MSKILFTASQVKKLSKKKWIKNISNKAITYTNEFKIKLVKETEGFKKFPQEVFKECGIDPEIVGIKRIQNLAYKSRKQIRETGKIVDARKGNSGEKLKRELSDKEKLKRVEAKIKLLEAENELFLIIELIREILSEAFKSTGENEMLKLLFDIMELCEKSENKHLIWFEKLIYNHFDGIITHVTHNISSGKIEGINNKIKTLRRQV